MTTVWILSAVGVLVAAIAITHRLVRGLAELLDE